MNSRKKLLVIGLDSAPPTLLFERFLPVMPTLRQLLEQGFFGPLRSVVPPITVPAWACMTTGKDPGALGLYGFRNRKAHAYELSVANAQDVPAPFVWETLAQQGRRCVALFVPPLYPPRHASSNNLEMLEVVGCLLTPDHTSPFASSPALQNEINQLTGGYIPDAVKTSLESDEDYFFRLCQMTEQHFTIAQHMWITRQPDFLMMVEIGLDRFHHHYFSLLETYGHRYYRLIDQCLSKLISATDPNTSVLIVSDHGVKTLLGGASINEFLISHQWLRLKPQAHARWAGRECFALKADHIDWAKTRAWAEGGYYGRVFLNLQGREPEGVVPPTAGASTLASLKELFTQFPLATECFRVEDLLAQGHYQEAKGYPPDLQVFFQNLDYRAVGIIGQHALIVNASDPCVQTHPGLFRLDGANHDWDGVIAYRPCTQPYAMQHHLPSYLMNVHRFMLSHFD